MGCASPFPSSWAGSDGWEPPVQAAVSKPPPKRSGLGCAGAKHGALPFPFPFLFPLPVVLGLATGILKPVRGMGAICRSISGLLPSKAPGPPESGIYTPPSPRRPARDWHRGGSEGGGIRGNGNPCSSAAGGASRRLCTALELPSPLPFAGRGRFGKAAGVVVPDLRAWFRRAMACVKPGSGRRPPRGSRWREGPAVMVSMPSQTR